jgi:phosphinothricin acetyltransferase
MSIRPAIKDDCAAIAEIYNHAVVHTAAIWNDKTVDTDNRIAWFEARQLAGFPVLVSEENGVITGYSSFGDWRAFDGFRHTVEHSVYVHPDHQGKGLGRKLLVALIAEARRLNKHVMVAGSSRRTTPRCICMKRWALSPPGRCRRWEPNLAAGWI